MPLFSFGKINTGTVILVILALLIYVYLRWLDKKEKSDKAVALYRQYAVLTPQTLASLPDEEVLRAVIANLLAKADRRRPDLYTQLALLSRGQAAVYSVWLLCRESETADFPEIPAASRRFAEPAITGFSLLGAADCAAALQALVTAFADGTVAPALSAAFRNAIALEQPLALCLHYIRENPEEFCDL